MQDTKVLHNIKIVINLYEVKLRYRTLIKTFKHLVKKQYFSLKYIEITESMLIKSFDKNIIKTVDKQKNITYYEINELLNSIEEGQ